MTMFEACLCLGIAPTKDENIIKSAYRELLPNTNPEEDPEAFMCLRDAYESALAFARSDESLESFDEPTGPIEGNTVYGMEVSDELLKWSEELLEMNRFRSKRLDEAEWKRLLDDDLLIDLEEGQTAERIFFYFLAQNYNHPGSIYRLIDRKLNVSARRKELTEFLPPAFLDFIERRIADEEGEQDFPFEWFSGADETDVEGFLADEFELEELNMEGEFAKARLLAEKMQEYGVSHPFFELELARLKLEDGETEAATEVAERLLREYPDSIRIQTTAADFLYKCGKKEEAVEVLRSVGDGKHLISLAQQRIAEYEMENGNYVKAVRECCKILDYHFDPMLYELADQIYQKIYEEFFEKARAEGAEPLPDDCMEVLLDAILHGKKYQEGIDFVEKKKEQLKGKAYVHRYLGRYYFFLNEFNKALIGCRRWREYLEKMEETEENKKLLARSYSYEGQIYLQQAYRIGIGRNAEDRSEKKELGEKAIEVTKTAIGLYEAVIYKRALAKGYICAGRGEEAVELLEKLMEQNPRDYMSKVILIEAYESVRNAQGIVDTYWDFHNEELYSNEVYEYMLGMLLDMDRTEQARQILDDAKKNELDSPKLRLLDFRCTCHEATDETGMEKARAMLRELERYHEEKPDEMLSEFMAQAYYEMALLCEYLQKPEDDDEGPKEHILYIRRALDMPYETLEFNYTYGRFLVVEGKFEEALVPLLKAEEECKGHWRETNICEHIGYCYDHIYEPGQALPYYERVLELEPEHDQIHGRLGRAYYHLLRLFHQREHAGPAIYHFEMQLKLDPDDTDLLRDFYYSCREGREYEKALEVAGRMADLRPDGVSEYYKAQALGDLRRFEDALGVLRDWIGQMTKETMDTDAFLLGGEICEKMGDCAGADKWYRQGIDHIAPGDSDRYSFWQSIYDLYVFAGKFEHAKAVYKDHIRKTPFLDELEMLKLDYRMAESESRRKWVRTKIRGKVFACLNNHASPAYWLRLNQTEREELANFAYFYGNDLKSAERILKEIIVRASNDEKPRLVRAGACACLRMVAIAARKGDKKTRDHYASLFRHCEMGIYDIKPFEATEQRMLGDLKEGMQNMYLLAVYYLGIGEMAKAEALIGEMMVKQPCDYCQYCNHHLCTDQFELQGMLAEAKGDLHAALAMYEKAYEIDKGNDYSMWRISVLKEKLG